MQAEDAQFPVLWHIAPSMHQNIFRYDPIFACFYSIQSNWSDPAMHLSGGHQLIAAASCQERTFECWLCKNKVQQLELWTSPCFELFVSPRSWIKSIVWWMSICLSFLQRDQWMSSLAPLTNEWSELAENCAEIVNTTTKGMLCASGLDDKLLHGRWVWNHLRKLKLPMAYKVLVVLRNTGWVVTWVKGM